MSRYCCDCQFWDFKYKNFTGEFGTCDHPLVEGSVVLEEEFDNEIVIHTEKHFGCIHCTPHHGNVVTKIDLDEED
jgi:hypothetical protein